VANNRTLGKVIANLRHADGLSQEELAHRANIHHTYVSQLERGLKSPTMTILNRIATALGTTASEIIKSAERKR
jgi:transcriptional regulator with XRE-family HTH domain